MISLEVKSSENHGKLGFTTDFIPKSTDFIAKIHRFHSKKKARTALALPVAGVSMSLRRDSLFAAPQAAKMAILGVF
jgi:hypothetical protein